MFNYRWIRFFSFTCLVYTLSFFIACEKGIQNNNEASPKIIEVLQNNMDTENIPKSETKDEQDNDFDPLGLPIISTIDGNHLKIISIAFEAFKIDREISEDKKNIENYKVELSENKEAFYIFFIAKLPKGEKLPVGGGTIFGKDTMFIVSKKDFTIKGRTFFK